MHCFGPWDDPDGALQKYLEQKDALHAGRKPGEVSAGVFVKDLCNRFLNATRGLVESGELTECSWQDYKGTCDLCVSHLGKGRLVADLDPDDFAAMRKAMAKRWGPVRLGNVIQRVRSVLKYGFDAGLLPRPLRPGVRPADEEDTTPHSRPEGPADVRCRGPAEDDPRRGSPGAR